MRGWRTIHSASLTAWLLLVGCGQSASSAASFAALYQKGPPEGVEVTHVDEHEHSPARTNALDDNPVVIRAALSHAAYTRTTPGTLALKIDLAAALEEASAQRPALNLALEEEATAHHLRVWSPETLNLPRSGT